LSKQLLFLGSYIAKSANRADRRKGERSQIRRHIVLYLGISNSEHAKMENKKDAEEAAEAIEDAARIERIRLLRLENDRLTAVKAASDLELARLTAERDQLQRNIHGPPAPQG
jgi:predicted AAA+ superfamily ATPase